MTSTIMFYNLENLYDIVDDPKTRDDDFTPSGKMKWTLDKYLRKLHNLGLVFSAVAKYCGDFPVFVGMSEVENRKVLSDLASQKMLSGAHYKVVHYESNDARGVDVGLFYRPDIFTLMGSEPVKLVLRSGREYIGRDILCVWGKMAGEMFAVYVCHFLSRRAGVGVSAGFRRAGAETVRDHASMMGLKFPGIKVVVMGDMNDTPADDSLAHLLKAGGNIRNVQEGEYFNPFWTLMERGEGTSVHKGKWKLYDNIIVSRNLLDGYEESHGLRLERIAGGQYGEIFRRSFFMSGKKPKSAFRGDFFQDGYSDHFPVIIRLSDK